MIGQDHIYFFFRKPVVLENCKSSQEGESVHPLHPHPRSAPADRSSATGFNVTLYSVTRKSVLYTSPLGDIVRNHGLSCHFYADGTQLYFSLKLHDQVASVQAIESCLNDIDEWMLANMLKLNRDETELLVIGPKHKVNPPIKSIHVAGDHIEASSSARNIGVLFDSHVNLEKHVMNTWPSITYRT